jgi:sulfur-oxidizing protein SoxA
VIGPRLRAAACLLALFSGTPASAQTGPEAEPKRVLPLDALRSGRAFLAPETRAQQDDLTLNPGMLWVEKGAALWRRPEGAAARSCASCHGDPASLAGAAARYPAYEPRRRGLINLEGRIQECRSERQQGAALAYESDDLLALTALVAHQSHGRPLNVRIDGPARPFFDAGRALYYERQGQLDLACAQCHEANWGKRLRAEPISQGHPNGYPTYRLEWQGVGSLHRRLRSCFLGVRAEPFQPGSADYVNLELFLAWRAQGLAVETPAVRR